MQGMCLQGAASRQECWNQPVSVWVQDGQVCLSQCSQLMHSKEVREGHSGKWAVVQLAKKRSCYPISSPGCAMAPSAAVAVPVLGLGSPFSWHPRFLMLPGQWGGLCVIVPKGAGRQGSCSQGSKVKTAPHPCAGRPQEGEMLSCFHQDDAVLH